MIGKFLGGVSLVKRQVINGTDGRAVASATKDPLFESHQHQNFLAVAWRDEKEAENDHVKKSFVCSISSN